MLTSHYLKIVLFGKFVFKIPTHFLHYVQLTPNYSLHNATRATPTFLAGTHRHMENLQLISEITSNRIHETSDFPI